MSSCTEWSSPFFPKLIKLCESISVEFCIDKSSDIEFLNVDFEKDTETANHLLYRILTDLFDIDKSSPVAVIMHHATNEDVLIDEKR